MADQELEEYEEEIEDQPAADAADNANRGFVGVHTVSFDDMQLKRELLRAIQDCGFEHPSESVHPATTLASISLSLMCLTGLFRRVKFAQPHARLSPSGVTLAV